MREPGCLLHSASLKAEPRRNSATRVKVLYGTPPGSATRHYEFNADDCESVMDLLEISSPFFVMLTTEFSLKETQGDQRPRNELKVLFRLFDKSGPLTHKASSNPFETQHNKAEPLY